MKPIKIKYSGPLLLVIFLLGWPAFSLAQEKEERIAPNDTITLTIRAGGKIQHKAVLAVSPKGGTINAPLIGHVRAAGLTRSQLEEQITQALAKDFFVDPKVDIQIEKYQGHQYYISGAVKKPGLHKMTHNTSLLELIAEAGGVSASAGNVAYIIRGAADKIKAGEKIEDLASQTEPVKADIYRLLIKGDMSVNVNLKSGDVVFIPPRESLDLSETKIYIDGEVEKPGPYDYRPGITAFNLCLMAGGFSKFAAPSRTKIFRKKGNHVEKIKINLNRVKDGKIPDVELQPGDRVHVPETWF